MAKSKADVMSLVRRWFRDYEREARADGFDEWRSDLECYVDVDTATAARRRLDATRQLVTTILAYRNVDGRAGAESVSAFLRKQTYRAADSPARWNVRLSGSPVDDVEIRVDGLDEIDFVDLFESLGFATIDIERHEAGPDPEPADIEALADAVREDFGFDFGDDEISLCFLPHARGLTVAVAEFDDDEEEGEEDDEGEGSDDDEDALGKEDADDEATGDSTIEDAADGDARAV